MSNELRILTLEDRPADAELVLRELAQQGIQCQTRRVMTEADFLEQLGSFQPDLILADYSLPAYDGLSALASVCQFHPEIPFIFVSGSLGEETAIEALHRGATDYVLKDRLSRLGPAVRRALRETQERRKRESAGRKIRELNLLLRAIRGVNQLIVREREPQTLLTKACEILVQTRGYLLAWVGLVEPESKRVALGGQAGKGAGYLEAATMTWDESATGLGPGAGTAMRTGQPWVCQDTATDPRFAPWRRLALERGFASVAAVPMMQGARALGALTVYSERAEAFVEEEIKLLSELAGDLALALQNIENENERIRTEQALREAYRFNEQIITGAQEGIVVYDHNLNYKVWNPYMERLTGHPASEVLGKEPAEVFPFLRECGVLRSLQMALHGESCAAEFQFRISGAGASLWASDKSGPLRDSKGEIIGVIGIVRNITERKRAEATLLQREEYFRALIENASDVITVINPDGAIRYQSPSVERVLGYTLEELLDRNFFDLVHPEDAPRVRAIFAAGLGQPVSLAREELRFRHQDGSWRVLEALARNLAEDPNVKGMVVNSRDITERKQLETQLRQAQKMEAVGQLAGGVAHDFNNVLAVIRGNADLLLLDADQISLEAAGCLKQIVHASERAANLTRQLLVFSRKQVAQPQPLLLNDLIQNLTKMLGRAIREDIQMECIYAEQLPFVQADPGMVEQVLLNLAFNARDAMPQGGHLRLATERVCFSSAAAPANPEARAGEFVCLSVSDTGTGIAPEHLRRIFEPFFTTKEPGKGTGLGLATVYGIVKQHQGWVEVASRLGEGTTFKIFLPAIPPPAPAAVAPQAQAEFRGGTETILLVEDDSAVRLITRHVLETYNYKVHEATCAREALTVWGRLSAEIALLLTDIVLPEGLSGRDLAEQLRAQRPGLKVIFMSGYSGEVVGKDTAFFHRLKSRFLHKPFSTSVLVQTVRQCLDE